MFDSLFGSPEGSTDPTIGGMSRADRMRGLTPASRDYGLYNTYGVLNYNTYGDTYGMFSDEDFDEIPEVTYRGLGLDPNAVIGMKNKEGLTGKIGSNIGDVYLTYDNTKSPHVVTDDGSLMSKDGTLVSTTNPYTGEKVSMLTDGSTKGSNEIVSSWHMGQNFAEVPTYDGNWTDLTADAPETVETPSSYTTTTQPVSVPDMYNDSNDGDGWSGSDMDTGNFGNSFNDVNDAGQGWWSKGGKIPSVQAGGK